MNDEELNELGRQVARDQFMASNRDHAEICKTIHDSYIRAGFSPADAMQCMFYRLDELAEWRCHNA